jgi:hypothetical protein
MVEPWELKQESEREADSLPTFIIFCEDEVSEPIYFKFFETQYIKVNVIGKQKSKIENVVKAITHCLNEDLMSCENGEYKLKKDETYIWCVFDRDKESENGELVEDDIKFNASIETAKRAGIKVAWSNDAFELWILIHFIEIGPEDGDSLHRKKYYDKLTEIFKNLKNPNDDLQKALVHAGFNYKKDLKQRNNFRSIVRPEIVEKTKIAIERSKKLEAYHYGKKLLVHQMAPCTLVHHLVEELLLVGKKDIA